MTKEFNSDFTELSYFNLNMKIINAIYEDTIENVTSSKIQTTGLDFYYVDDDTVNASVNIIDNKDVMKINTGTLIKIYSLVKSAFTNKKTFKNIGNTRLENNQIINGKFFSNGNHIMLTGECKDETRRVVSEYVSLFALRFISMHELGHLMNGHAHFVGSLYGNYKIEMINKYKLSKYDKKMQQSYALDRRTLEMDADAFASTASMNNLVGFLNNRHEEKLIFDALENPFQIFELWSFAVHLIFLEFEKNMRSEYSTVSYYLPNSARMTLLIGSASEALSNIIKKGEFNCTTEERKIIDKYMYRGISESENFYNRIHHTNFNLLQELMNENLSKYSKEVQNHWNDKLRHELGKYSRATLYDPDEV